MKYKILESKDKIELEKLVMVYMSRGYQLAGGHQINVIEYDTRTNSQGQYYRNPDKWIYRQSVYKEGD